MTHLKQHTSKWQDAVPYIVVGVLCAAARAWMGAI